MRVRKLGNGRRPWYFAAAAQLAPCPLCCPLIPSCSILPCLPVPCSVRLDAMSFTPVIHCTRDWLRAWLRCELSVPIRSPRAERWAARAHRSDRRSLLQAAARAAHTGAAGLHGRCMRASSHSSSTQAAGSGTHTACPVLARPPSSPLSLCSLSLSFSAHLILGWISLSEPLAILFSSPSWSSAASPCLPAAAPLLLQS